MVGYGTQKKATLTGAVASLKGEELAKVSQPNMKANLIGKIRVYAIKSLRVSQVSIARIDLISVVLESR